MVKKFKDNSRMADMFVQQVIDEKTAWFEAARTKLENQIQALEESEDTRDSGLSAAETRNDINALKAEIRTLDARYQREIAQLKANGK